VGAPRLYQFSYSIYCEKVRWALDYKAQPWWRENLLPGPHLVTTLRMSGQRYLPVLEWDGKRVADSTRILQFLEERLPDPALYPTGASERRRALKIEDFCDEKVGPALKRLSYSLLLPHTRYCATLMSLGQRPAVKRTYELTFPAVRKSFQAAMGLTPRRIEKARDQLDRALDRLEGEIGATGYMVGGSFSVADLAAAAALSPLLPRPYSPYRMQSNVPDDVREWRESYRDRPAVAWACRIYKQYRGTCFAENGELVGSGVI
jgi:glutathione S-transferase